MSSELNRLRNALADIAKAAREAVGGHESGGDDDGAAEKRPGRKLVCTPKYLPPDMQVEAAQHAARINPFNQPEFGPMHQLDAGLDLTPELIAIMTAKYWGPTPRTLSVSFMETTAVDLRRRILSHMNAWNRTACIQFAETQGVGDVRISRGPGGFFSYLGTDVLLIARNEQTMNLEGFTMNTPESEYKRVIRHETGHTLGFPHEHMRRTLVARIDPDKAIRFFGGPPNFWSPATVRQQVLTPLDERSLMATPADETSIMCYQLPGSITRDGRAILGGVDINASDFAFAGKIYPKVAPGHGLAIEDDSEENVEALEEAYP